MIIEHMYRALIEPHSPNLRYVGALPMPFSDHTRVSFGGKLLSAGEPDEQWNCNVSVQLLQGDAPVGEDARYLTQIAGPLAAWFSLAAHQISTSATLEYVKANLIGPTGAYVDPNGVNQHIYAPAPAGGTLPGDASILSCCISWTTQKSRGPGAFGRIYLPNFTAGLQGTMKVALQYQNRVKQAGVDLLTVLTNAGGAAGNVSATPVVASSKDGTNTPITGVRVGDIMDVQRRRKNKYNEVYV